MDVYVDVGSGSMPLPEFLGGVSMQLGILTGFFFSISLLCFLCRKRGGVSERIAACSGGFGGLTLVCLAAILIYWVIASAEPITLSQLTNAFSWDCSGVGCWDSSTTMSLFFGWTAAAVLGLVCCCCAVCVASTHSAILTNRECHLRYESRVNKEVEKINNDADLDEDPELGMFWGEAVGYFGQVTLLDLVPPKARDAYEPTRVESTVEDERGRRRPWQEGDAGQSKVSHVLVDIGRGESGTSSVTSTARTDLLLELERTEESHASTRSSSRQERASQQEVTASSVQQETAPDENADKAEWCCWRRSQPDEPQIATGLRWHNVGQIQPDKGYALKHAEALSEALEKHSNDAATPAADAGAGEGWVSQLSPLAALRRFSLGSDATFSKEQWDAFGIPSVRAHHFIQVGDSYWQPAEAGKARWWRWRPMRPAAQRVGRDLERKLPLTKLKAWRKEGGEEQFKELTSNHVVEMNRLRQPLKWRLTAEDPASGSPPRPPLLLPQREHKWLYAELIKATEQASGLKWCRVDKEKPKTGTELTPKSPGLEAVLQGKTALGMKWRNIGEVQPTRGRALAATGLLWRRIVTKPTQGQELTNERLSAALKRKVKVDFVKAEMRSFSQVEWDAFGILCGRDDLRPTNLRPSHFIQSGENYFQPAIDAAGAALADALHRRSEFTRAEWTALSSTLSIKDLRYDDFIKSGANYYVPDHPAETTFTEAEWDAVNVPDLRVHHFVKAGDYYFRPADKGARAHVADSKKTPVVHSFARADWRKHAGEKLQEVLSEMYVKVERQDEQPLFWVPAGPAFFKPITKLESREKVVMRMQEEVRACAHLFVPHVYVYLLSPASAVARNHRSTLRRRAMRDCDASLVRHARISGCYSLLPSPGASPRGGYSWKTAAKAT